MKAYLSKVALLAMWNHKQWALSMEVKEQASLHVGKWHLHQVPTQYALMPQMGDALMPQMGDALALQQ